ncbi:MAG: hypothetical protein Q8Q33_03255 [Chlamydiota bacterium]|nr:hypothetical protein [Chlamydiota bacterium]
MTSLHGILAKIKDHMIWLFHQEILPRSDQKGVCNKDSSFLHFVMSHETLEKKEKRSGLRKSFIRWVLSPEKLEGKEAANRQQVSFFRWIFKKENLS